MIIRDTCPWCHSEITFSRERYVCCVFCLASTNLHVNCDDAVKDWNDARINVNASHHLAADIVYLDDKTMKFVAVGKRNIEHTISDLSGLLFNKSVGFHPLNIMPVKFTLVTDTRAYFVRLDHLEREKFERRAFVAGTVSLYGSRRLRRSRPKQIVPLNPYPL